MKAALRRLEILPRRPGLRIASSKLFWAPDVPPPGPAAEAEYRGLRTRLVLGSGVLYVADDVQGLWEEAGRPCPRRCTSPPAPDDRLVERWVRAAEARMARLGVDPLEDAGYQALLDTAPRRWAWTAPALYRWLYDYGVLTALFLAADRLAITDVMVTEADDVVLAESWRHGLLRTNIELSVEDRRALQDRVSMRVGALSAYSPFVSRADARWPVRVTGIAPDVAPRPAFAFRVMRHWLPPGLLALGAAEPWQMAYLCLAWRRGMVILAAGEPGSGKTSLVNAVIACTPTARRLAIVQSVPELWVPQAAFVAVERLGLGAGVPDVLMAQLVQRFGLRANSDVAINELLTETDVRAFVTVVFAGFGAAATIHARSPQEVLLRLARLGVSEAELAALLPRLVIPVMERQPRRRLTAIWEPRWLCPCGRENRPWAERCQCGRPRPERPAVAHRPLAREEALADPEAARWADALAEAARNPAVDTPEGWTAFLRSLEAG